MGASPEKHRLSVLTAASRGPRPNRVSGVDAHNAALRAAQARVDELEEKLADLLVPILEQAGAKAASAFRTRAPVGLVAALTAAGPGVTSASTMIALKPRPDEAAALELSSSIPAETLHVTLAYLGETDGPLEAIAETLRSVAADHAALVGEVAGGGGFGHPDGAGPMILLPDVPGLVELRVDVTEALAAAKISYSRDHGFQAHVTIGYRDPEEGDVVDVEGYDPVGVPLHFDALLVVRGDTEIVEIPLVGTPPLTAASPPNWIPPAGDEIVDVEALVAKLRTKTDPVRRALVEASMTPGLAAAGEVFDVTNPFTEKVLSRAGQNVTSIAQTTQLNVMRAIKAAYANGLSIPDTATAIQAGMAAAAPARARMIARTELAGAVNGGSLAATQIVSDATGDRYVKRWLTAPGAPNPRHELYEGLDGQEQPLDGLFDVGGSPLQFPGDPDGDEGETINCRCTLVYNSPEGEGEASADDAPPDVSSYDDGSLAVDTPPEGDTVSVASGPFVPTSMVERIAELGLDRPLDDLTPTTTVGRDVFATSKDTEGIYKVAGEWAPDRRALHDDIVAKHFEGKVATEGKPSAYFTAGGGASGKSQALFNVDGADVGLKDLGDRADVVWIDPDRIKAMLPEYEKLRDAGDLYAASGVHEESSALAKEITAEAQRRGLSMIVDTTGSSSGFVQKLQAASDAGYEVKTTMFSIPTNEAIARSMARGDRSGRYVAIRALKGAHAGSAKQLGIWKDSPIVKDWRVYDNSGASPKLVASGGGGSSTIFDQKAWDEILAKANEKTAAPSTAAAPSVPTSSILADLKTGDPFIYEGQRFKVVGPKKNGIEVQHVATKAKQVAAADIRVDLPKPKAPGNLVGRSAESYLNRVQEGTLEKLTEAEVRDIENYTGTAYRSINSGLRSGDELSGLTSRRVANLDSAISKSAALDENVTLWRGVGSWRSVFDTSSLDDLVGKTVTDRGFVSTTTRQNVALGSTNVAAAVGKNRAIVKIHAPKGTHGVWVKGLSKFVSEEGKGVKSSFASSEGEYLLPRGSRFRVVSVSRGILPEIEVELLP